VRLLAGAGALLLLAGCPFDTTPQRRCDPELPDPQDREGYDEDCDGIDGEIERSVFVSPEGSDAHSGRAPDEPLLTLGAAGELARTACDPSCDILLAAGRYDDGRTYEPVTGVSHYGGYSLDFSQRNSDEHTATIAATGAPVAVLASGLGRATWDGLTIEGADFDATAAGTSSYALWVRGGSGILLDTVTLVGGDGAPGIPGAAGAVAETCGNEGGDGGVGFDCGSEDGQPGDTGRDGTAAGPPGPSSADNNCPSACPLVGSDGISDGGDAPGPGGDGPHGDEGTTHEDAAGTFTVDGWIGSDGGDGTRGEDGAGGGGGGSGGSKKFRACFGCDTLPGATGGRGGDGGCGGDAGAGGGAGGGSFGLVLENATAELRDVRVVTGNGGLGGAGGTGATGAAGAAGSPGGDPPEQRCGLIDYLAGGGGHGGAGGRGGSGGGGAGGNGGVVVGIALLGDSAAADGVEVVLEGVPGAGGDSGAGGDGADPGPAGLTGIVVESRAWELPEPL
jgi:hypothetical protein